MKTFTVEKEYIKGEIRRMPVYSDGTVYGESYDVDGEETPRYVVIGFNVYVYDDMNLENVEFYPVKTDFNRVMVEDEGITYAYNRDEVIEQIKADFPPETYQNHDW